MTDSHAHHHGGASPLREAPTPDHPHDSQDEHSGDGGHEGNGDHGGHGGHDHVAMFRRLF
ncbi:hypothetical protein M3E18_07535 [Kocuria sp. p3-SID1433]|nr:MULTISPECIES: hypothetical protein [unclassified Kocuria]MCT1602168.1 hypothetical protein [Kocuria sp. p3-SID1428]MCT2180381.1 hypothetical protein [Kocuria sp. p3-SID1433]